jgi:hypothetical protein
VRGGQLIQVVFSHLNTTNFRNIASISGRGWEVYKAERCQQVTGNTSSLYYTDNVLMIFRGKIIAVSCENHTKHEYTLWAECGVLVHIESRDLKEIKVKSAILRDVKSLSLRCLLSACLLTRLTLRS